MEEKRILELVEKFEKSINETEKLTNALLGLEGVIEKLNNSMHEVYELTKIDAINEKSVQLIANLNELKEAQKNVNKEYKEIVNINLYNSEIKEEIKELKNHIVKIDGDVSSMKLDIDYYKKAFEEENLKFKIELINLLRENNYIKNEIEEN